MKAAYCSSFGAPEVVEVREVSDPIAKEDEVLIRILGTTVSSGDARIRSQTFPRGFNLLCKIVFGIKKPKKPILGIELSGIIESVGEKVSRFLSVARQPFIF